MPDKERSEDDVIQQAYAQWLEHPITKGVIRKLEVHAEKHKALIVTEASNNEISDAQLRRVCVALRTVHACIELIKIKNIDLTKSEKLNLE